MGVMEGIQRVPHSVKRCSDSGNWNKVNPIIYNPFSLERNVKNMAALATTSSMACPTPTPSPLHYYYWSANSSSSLKRSSSTSLRISASSLADDSALLKAAHRTVRSLLNSTLSLLRKLKRNENENGWGFSDFEIDPWTDFGLWVYFVGGNVCKERHGCWVRVRPRFCHGHWVSGSPASLRRF